MPTQHSHWSAKPWQWCGNTLRNGVFGLVLLAAALGTASAQSVVGVVTDRPDFVTGEAAFITGADFWIGESVTLEKSSKFGRPIFVFSNSWADNGNYQAELGNFPEPYQPDRYTNGLVWPDILATIMRTEIAPSSAGGTNYSFWGAPAALEWGWYPGITGVEQVQQYLADSGGSADPEATYIINLGGNDCFTGFFYGLTPEANAGIALGALTAMVQDLVDAGAQRILVSTVDLRLDPGYAMYLPFIPGGAEVVDATVEAFNRGIHSLPAQFPPGVVRVADEAAFHRFALDHPRPFGISNTTEACFDFETLCPNPNDYFYFDPSHPSESGHRAMALFYANQVLRR